MLALQICNSWGSGPLSPGCSCHRLSKRWRIPTTCWEYTWVKEPQEHFQPCGFVLIPHELRGVRHFCWSEAQRSLFDVKSGRLNFVQCDSVAMSWRIIEKISSLERWNFAPFPFRGVKLEWLDWAHASNGSIAGYIWVNMNMFEITARGDYTNRFKSNSVISIRGSVTFQI